MPPRQAWLEHLPSEKGLRELGLFSQGRQSSRGSASAYGEAAEKRAMLLTVMSAERMRGTKLKKQSLHKEHFHCEGAGVLCCFQGTHVPFSG